jgi:glycosyltransferase involved in cell wall biosynthesis
MRDFRHILAYWAARKVKSKFILGLASDLDIMSFRKRCKHFYFANIGQLWWLFDGILTELVYPWLIRNSDFVFVQHTGQQAILKAKNISTTLFPNLIDFRGLSAEAKQIKKDYIYVGSIDKRKGIEEFYQIVLRTPSSTYRVVGMPRDKTGKKYYEKLKFFPNVTLMGRLSHSDTILQISNSKALISTSAVEGFPNIFLEAWACGVPVLSLYVNPGNIIMHENIGYFADGNIEKLLQFMATVNSDETISDRAKVYIDQNHIINDQKIKEIGALFTSIGSH